jgi:hypothetical protein
MNSALVANRRIAQLTVRQAVVAAMFLSGCAASKPHLHGLDSYKFFYVQSSSARSRELLRGSLAVDSHGLSPEFSFTFPHPGSDFLSSTFSDYHTSAPWL